ncbi:MAG TPA: hypothetical protein ENO20_01125 [Bacteroides sp.]|nr:hypothetical protein [Bacteroides sp.]
MKTFVSHVSVCITVCALLLVYSCKEEPTPEPGPEPSENIDILEGQTLVLDKLSKNLSSNTLEDAIDLTMQWAEEQPYVALVRTLYNGLEITYKSGMIGLVVHFEWDENGKIKDSKHDPGSPDMTDSFIKSVSGNLPKSTDDLKATDNEYIGNKKILIWSPFESDFSSTFLKDDGDEIFSSSYIDLEVDYLLDKYCTVESVQDFANYGMVLIESHGNLGEWITTGEEYSEILRTWFLDDCNAYRLGISSFQTDDGKSKHFFCVRHTYIKEHCGKSHPFPRSVVFNSSCESTMTDSLSAAFMSNGVKTYYGFNKSVTHPTCVLTEKMVFMCLTNYFFNTGESFIPDWCDPKTGARFDIMGSNKMAYEPSYWQGTFSYEQGINESLDEGEGHVKTWNIQVDAQFDLKFVVDDPYSGSFIGPYYFSDDIASGTLEIQYNYLYEYPGGSTTCNGSCSDEITTRVADLIIDAETGEYQFHFVFDNSPAYGGSPCVATCTSGYPHEVERALYLTPVNWPAQYGSLPTHATFEEDVITGKWSGPPPNLPDIGTYDNCRIVWSFNKIIP